MLPELKNVEPAVAWGKMPDEMRKYIYALPEFNKEIWEKITGIDVDKDEMFTDDARELYAKGEEETGE